MFTEKVRRICEPNFCDELTSAFQSTNPITAVGIMSELWGKPMYSGHNLPWRGRIVLDTNGNFLDYFEDMKPVKSGRLQENNEFGDGIQEPILSPSYPLHKAIAKFLPKQGDEYRLKDYSLKREEELIGGSYDGIYVDFLVLRKRRSEFQKFTFGLKDLPDSVNISPVDAECFSGLDKLKHRVGDVQCDVRGCGLWFPEAPLESLMHPRICSCGGLIHVNFATKCYSGAIGGYYDNKGTLKETRYQSLKMCDKCKICTIVKRDFKDLSKLN